MKLDAKGIGGGPVGAPDPAPCTPATKFNSKLRWGGEGAKLQLLRQYDLQQKKRGTLRPAAGHALI